MQRDNFSLNHLTKAATERWLTAQEYDYLLDLETTPLMVSTQPPNLPPPSGTLLLFDRNRTLYYKSDGHEWVKKKKNKSKVREDHTKLRIDGKPRIGGVYAHCETIQSLHRRGYYQLNPETGKTRYPFEPPGTKTKSSTSKHVTSLIILHYLNEDNITLQNDRTQGGNEPKLSCKKTRPDISNAQKVAKAKVTKAKFPRSHPSNLKDNSLLTPQAFLSKQHQKCSRETVDFLDQDIPTKSRDHTSVSNFEKLGQNYKNNTSLLQQGYSGCKLHYRVHVKNRNPPIKRLDDLWYKIMMN